MNPWALSALVAVLATTALCVVAYSRDSRAPLNRAFIWYGALPPVSSTFWPSKCERSRYGEATAW